ncbi:hypothetical protein M427DRAFT_60063 [Gonapodya prolifera JEL478]|uniref:Uncharacterized protein n=1 Tax=Gonapodya prolifera (strain JEL478) TaxID=1344416 RepID=A0A139A647_GONPJ|nr:hypothetical protein M427DRAFT_60063 [Gonapodya prolifera JEL478]|eukprot:KXS11925.1 hypothetical protein M427DRAFT_60063 [Gonapodya prolifera JEL478]
MSHPPPSPRLVALLARILPLFVDSHSTHPTHTHTTRISLDDPDTLFALGKALELALCVAGVKPGWLGLSYNARVVGAVQEAVGEWGRWRWDGMELVQVDVEVVGVEEGIGKRFVMLPIKDQGKTQLGVLDAAHLERTVTGTQEFAHFLATVAPPHSDADTAPTTNGDPDPDRNPSHISTFLTSHPTLLGAALGYRTPGDHGIYTPSSPSPSPFTSLSTSLSTSPSPSPSPSPYTLPLLTPLALRLSIRPTRPFLRALAAALAIPPPRGPHVDALPFVVAFAGRPANLLSPTTAAADAHAHAHGDADADTGAGAGSHAGTRDSTPSRSKWDAILADYISIASLCHACGVGGAELAVGNEGWERSIVSPGAGAVRGGAEEAVGVNGVAENAFGGAAQENGVKGDATDAQAQTQTQAKAKADDPWDLFD